jgi:L-arabinose transport system ATP-binding protein
MFISPPGRGIRCSSSRWEFPSWEGEGVGSPMNDFLEFNNISKVFPGVRALDNVSFGVAKGCIHGLVGENGAGKSTLLKILSGAYIPTAGDVFINHEKKVFHNTRDALHANIAVIYQELNLVPDLSVAENLLLGHIPQTSLFIDKKQMYRIAQKQIEELMEHFDPKTKVRNLSIGQRQMIEIGKALLHNAEILAFDEPTSSLSEREVTQLFKIIKNLRHQEKAIIYVSHRLEEIFKICDTVTVFRDGKHIETFADMKQVTHNLLVQRMVGREIKDIYGYRPRPKGETLFEVKQLRGKGLTQDISFTVSKGEIVGFFGLVGAGRTELLKTIFGATPLESGHVLVNGHAIPVKNPPSAINHGICLSPEDRKYEGIIPVRSVSENINISCRRHFLRAGLFLNKKKERENTDHFIDKLAIKTPSRNQLIGNLSGGNQQKTILARWLSEKVDVFLLDEPTRGIDVGAKYEIYQLMYQLAEEGKAVVFVSSDLPEVMGVADRVIVMRDGAITGELDRKDVAEERILSMALPEA